MIVIPAIDLRAGRCVRLVEGRLENETIYSTNPVDVASGWQDQGASRLHVIDLDGAFAGAPKNLDVIGEIVGRVNIPVQVGGGVRSMETIERLFDLGVDRVILGTVAIINPSLVEEACQKYGERVAVGIDTASGQVAIEGWGVTVGKSAVDLALEMKEIGVRRVVYTDVKRDGTLKGPNVTATELLAGAAGLKVIASGGVSDLSDLLKLKALEPLGVEAVILGKALYAGQFTLQEACALVAGE